jgi:raffinose/stachyose/melibiose transport system substrate-binding protein
VKKPIVLILFVVFLSLLVASFSLAQKKTIKMNYEGAYFVQISEEFMKRNPDIKVEANQAGLDVFESGQLKLALAAGTGPDIMQLDAAPARMGLLAYAGLLLPLDEYYRQYGWNFFPWSVKWATYGGKKYGVPHEIEFIGPLYNRRIYERAGIGVPKTYEEFVSHMRKIKGAGYIPLAWGIRNCCASGHYYSNFIEAAAGIRAVEDMLFGDGKWTHPGFIRAAKEIQELVRGDLITKQANSLTGAEQMNLIWEQKASTTITGSWAVSQVLQHSDLALDWYMLPVITPGLDGRYTGGLGSGFCVSAKTKYPDEVAKLIDFMFFSKEGRKIIVEVGKHIPPVPLNLADFEIDPFFKSVVEKANDPRGIGYNLSVVIPAQTKNTYYEVIQGWAGFMLTPEAGAQMIQKAWEKDIAEGYVQR